LPDPKGKLTKQELVEAARFINEKSKIPGDACLVCGDTDTRVSRELLGLPVTGLSGTNLGRMQIVLPVTCHNCGFVRYFHAAGLGLIPEPEPEQEPEPEPEQEAGGEGE
jgi:hypothetical protein